MVFDPSPEGDSLFPVEKKMWLKVWGSEGLTAINIHMASACHIRWGRLVAVRPSPYSTALCGSNASYNVMRPGLTNPKLDF